LNPIRRLLDGFGVSAPRLAIKPYLSWRRRGVVITFLISAAVFAAWHLFDMGRRLGALDHSTFEKQVETLTAEVRALKADNAQLASTAQGLQRQSQIDKATQAELTRSLSQLQNENARLKEEVGFFHGIMSSGKLGDGLSVQDLKIERDGQVGEYRYHALLVQGGSRDKDFVGRAQLVLNVEKNGLPQVLIVPDDEKNAALQVNFKYYQRLEGRFKLVPGTVLKSAQLRVIDTPSGRVRVAQSASLS
jgi:cell division protein FtsB